VLAFVIFQEVFLSRKFNLQFLFCLDQEKECQIDLRPFMDALPIIVSEFRLECIHVYVGFLRMSEKFPFTQTHPPIVVLSSSGERVPDESSTIYRQFTSSCLRVNSNVYICILVFFICHEIIRTQSHRLRFLFALIRRKNARLILDRLWTLRQFSSPNWRRYPESTACLTSE